MCSSSTPGLEGMIKTRDIVAKNEQNTMNTIQVLLHLVKFNVLTPTILSARLYLGTTSKTLHCHESQDISSQGTMTLLT